MFAAIIFDLGGVVLSNSWRDNNEEKYKEFEKEFHITRQDMDEAWISIRKDFIEGKITEDEFWLNFLRRAGKTAISEEDIERAKTLWRKHQKENIEVVKLILKLKKSYNVAALTNTPLEWFEYKRNKFNLDDLFDEIIVSSMEGLSKPEKEIYKIALKRLNAKPKECIFIDNKLENLLPAKELGMKTIHFLNINQLKEELEKLGVEIS